MICKVFRSIAALTASSSLALAGPLDTGAAIPKISCLDQNGQQVSLAELAGNEWVLVYFYPKADTPGCTKQACSLRDSYEKMAEHGVRVIGVSTDSIGEQKAFANKFNLPFTLLADEGGNVVKAFGVPKVPVIGFAKRQAFLFQRGKLVWRDLTASTDQQANDVLTQIKTK